MKNKIMITLLHLCLGVISSISYAKNVIVIGAGISGLAAANYLTTQHIPVTVLEASDHVGGRISTFYKWGPGLDLGASWIHGIKQNSIAKLVDQHHIATQPTVYDDNDFVKRLNASVIYTSSGKKLSADTNKKLYVLAKELEDYVALHRHDINNKSIEDDFHDFVKQKHITGEMVNLLHYTMAIMFTYEYAEDTDKLSAAADVPYDNSKVSGANVIFPQGYQQILPLFEKNFPIKLKQKVRQIHYSSTGVDIDTQDQHYHADAIIITVPLGVLKTGDIQFTPDLPKEKLASIKNLSMGVYDKVYLLFDKPFWDKKAEWIGYVPQKHNEQPIDIMNYYKFTQKPILLIFSGGTLARNLENLSNEQVIAFIMQDLKKIYGKDIPEPTSYTMTRWNNNPLSHGSYSYLPVGSNVKNYQILAKPVQNCLFFAGEATSTTDPATVHGAYNTGIRAAKEVNRSLRSTRNS